MPTPRSAPGHASNRAARRLALSAVFEADFGQHTAAAALARQVEELQVDAVTEAYADRIVTAVVRHRDAIDGRIETIAPAYPVVQLARIDRALLRCGMGELLHCRTTPARVVISEWVGLARTYSGEPARRLLNGVLGRVASETMDQGTDPSADRDPDGGR